MAGAIEPFANISAQELLEHGISCHGWVRKKDTSHFSTLFRGDCKYVLMAMVEKALFLILGQEYFILHIFMCRSLSPHTYDNQTNKITTYIIPCFPLQGLGVL